MFQLLLHPCFTDFFPGSLHTILQLGASKAIENDPESVAPVIDRDADLAKTAIGVRRARD